MTQPSKSASRPLRRTDHRHRLSADPGLQSTEGKLFRPMALTVIFALAGSMIVSLTVMPVLASLALSTKPSKKNPGWCA